MVKIVLFLLFVAHLYGQQDTCSGKFQYFSQQEIEADEMRLLSCTTLNSHVYIDGHFDIGRRKTFESFSAFRNVESIEGYLILIELIASNSLEGFKKLTSINQGIMLLEVGASEISGFEELAQINEEILIEGSEFESIKGLKNVSGSLKILSLHENENLLSIDGLQGFESDTSDGNTHISIYGNPQLKSLKGIENMTVPQQGILELTNNKNLTDCAQKNICEALIRGRSLWISRNGLGCNSKEEVLQQCLTKIEDIKFGQVNIYPNPVKNELWIDNDSEIRYAAIMDMTGKVCVKEKGVDGKIDIEGLPKGIYTISITTADQVVNKIFLKE